MKKGTQDKKIKKILIIAGIAAGILLTAYIGISIYFMSHFCFRTKLNGTGVSGYSADKVLRDWQDEIKNYKLEITERDGTVDELKGEDIGLELQWDDTVKNLIKKQNGFTWINRLFDPDNITSYAIVTFDKTKFDAAVKELNCMSDKMQVMPVDATASEYDKDDGFTVVEAVDGTAIDPDSFIKGIEDCIYGLKENYDISKDGGYIQPQIKGDNDGLKSAVDKMNEYAKSVITYQIGDDTDVLDAGTFGEWLEIQDDMSVTIDTDKILAYVKGLEKKYNTFGRAEKLATSYGQTVTIDNNHYGWKIDEDAEAEQIKNDIEGGEPVTRDLNYKYTANSHTGNDYGNSYVEINLTAQHLFVYKDGSLVVESDFVSGNTSKGNGTPTGVFGLTYKQKDATLNGENYSTPVSFWMPFNGNVGMHDATWRSTFGGVIYKSRGSHGCVNLPYSVAETIYNMVEKNYPILVYELPGTENTAAADKDAAGTVISAIDEIGEVTLESADAISSARSQYDSLSDTAKSYVSNYQALVDAETYYAQLQEQAQQGAVQQPEADQQEMQPSADPQAPQTDEEQPAADAGTQ